jgi:23S rRNA pseudoU1915 N3-methylase RlmH
MADEMKKLEQELKKFSTRFEKSTNDWMKYVDSESDKVVKFVRDNTKDLSDTIARERKKIELRSQIGEHTRSLEEAKQTASETLSKLLKEGNELKKMSVPNPEYFAKLIVSGIADLAGQAGTDLKEIKTMIEELIGKAGK